MTPLTISMFASQQSALATGPSAKQPTQLVLQVVKAGGIDGAKGPNDALFDAPNLRRRHN
jgi:hypothetical protein